MRTVRGTITIDYAIVSDDFLIKYNKIYLLVDEFDPCLSDTHHPIRLEVEIRDEAPHSETNTF